MKVHSTVKDLLTDTKGNTYLSLIVSNYRQGQLLHELEQDVVYSVDIKKVKSKRSINQNALMWRLLHELEKVTREPAIDWYVKALVDTGAVVDYVWGTEDTESTLKKSFRSVQRVKPYKIKDTDGWLYRVIVGSSKFNIAEMNELIDTVMRYCAENDIPTDVLDYE